MMAVAKPFINLGRDRGMRTAIFVVCAVCLFHPAVSAGEYKEVVSTYDNDFYKIESKNILIRTEQIDDNGKKVLLTRTETLEKIKDANIVVEGANLIRNEYGSRLFADFFFFITGFHGFHVFSGVVINVIIFFNVILGTYERRGHYEMVEKVGLYWHFVDLVWVFVFTFFYLV